MATNPILLLVEFKKSSDYISLIHVIKLMINILLSISDFL